MSTNPKARAWVQVRADALSANYRRVEASVGPDTRLLPMVKADAYGLGVERVVACLRPLGPWGFGVAAVSEGVRLRTLGVTEPVVVCSPVPTGDLPAAVEHDLQLSLSSLGALRAAADEAGRQGRRVGVHVDLDTGMGRSGFDWRRADVWLPAVADAPDGVDWVGLGTHLHSADDDPPTIDEQWGRFREVADRAIAARSDGTSPLMLHVLNSAGSFRAPERAEAFARPGIFLYGGAIGAGQPVPEPVVSVHARIALIRDVPGGTTLGYGSTYRASGPERWATLTIGYGDGLPRALSNRGCALVRGARVPIVGRISMDVTVVDITDVPEAREGDVATLVGRDGDLERTIDDVALEAGTISYEVLTGLTARLPRVWTEGAA